MIAIPQSVTRRILLKAYLSTDGVTLASGKTIAVVISKNGAAFANPSAGATNATEIANGWYYVDLSVTDTGTQGPIAIRGTASGVDDVETYRYVADPNNAGFAGVPAVAAGASGGLPLGDASGRVDIGKLLGTAWLTPNVAGTPDVNAKLLGGTAQTGRDVGASVLLSSGTGTGQLDFTSGVVKSNLAQILGTALTETAGLIAAAFKQFFNVSAPTGTVNLTPRCTLTDTVTTYTGNTPQTGDNYARIGAAGASLTALGDTRIAHLDADVSSRTKPADTQAAVTSLTNAPTAGDFTPAMKTSLSAATPSVTVSDKTGFSLSGASVTAIWAAVVDSSGVTTLLSRIGSVITIAGGKIAATLTSTDVTGNLPAQVKGQDDIDFGAFQKASLNAATPASITGAVGSVTGAVGSVTGSVGSVASYGTLVADVVTAVWGAGTRTLSSFGTLAADSAAAVWNALTSSMTTAGSIGKKLADWVIGAATVTLDASQPNYAPAKAGDAMTLTSAYDAAKTALATSDLVMTAGKVWALDGNGNAIAAASDVPTAAQNADKLLGRNLAGGSDGVRTVCDALRPSRNKVVVDVVAKTITVYAEDDATIAWTGMLTTDSSAAPITALDPA